MGREYDLITALCPSRLILTEDGRPLFEVEDAPETRRALNLLISCYDKEVDSYRQRLRLRKRRKR